ncbi:MAG: N-acetylmuramoyl-L-alanine amidase [Hornefia sp.]|nr:N-acetylmuramoyl-L-alanine amidase [Hornefia sp.]
MGKRDYNRHELTDLQIRRIIRQRRRRKQKIKVATRLGVIFLSFILMVSLITFGINKFFFSEKGAQKRGIIFVDPGHGGNDPGAESSGRREKDDTLRIGLLIKTHLEKKGFKVSMSRTSDEYVDRKERAEMANEVKAQLFVSLHRNKALEGKGVEMWIPSYNVSKDNANEKLLSRNIMSEIKKVGVSQDRGIHSGVLYKPKEDYEENKYTNMPSVLIEFGFISDKEDNKLFDENIDEYAAAVAKGLDITFASLYETE